MTDNLLVFGLDATKEYAAKVAKHLGLELSNKDEKYFEDGEPYLRSMVNVRGRDVFVIQSLYSDENESASDKFVKLLWFIGSLVDARAERITAVLPYTSFRQDRKTQSREPITTKYIAWLMEAIGADQTLTMDAHNLSAIQNGFRVSPDNLESKNLFADWCANNLPTDRPLVVLSPDSGGLPRSRRFRNAFGRRIKTELDVVIMDKVRVEGKVQGSRIVGNVKGTNVIIYDDMISTGSTMWQAYQAVQNHGGQVVAICATHGLFVGKANEYFDNMETNIVVCDTIPPFRLNTNNLKKTQVLDTTEMVAEAIRRIHNGTGSISELLK